MPTEPMPTLKELHDEHGDGYYFFDNRLYRYISKLPEAIIDSDLYCHYISSVVDEHTGKQHIMEISTTRKDSKDYSWARKEHVPIYRVVLDCKTSKIDAHTYKKIQVVLRGNTL